MPDTLSFMNICPKHGIVLRTSSGLHACYQCEQELANAPLPTRMTPDEREDEMRRWIERVPTVPSERAHERIQILVGRPINQNEYLTSWDDLIQEARGRG